MPASPVDIHLPEFITHSRHGTGECRLADGDRIVLYTDGLYEILNPAGDDFGPERLMISLARHSRLPGPELLAAVLRTSAATPARPCSATISARWWWNTPSQAPSRPREGAYPVRRRHGGEIGACLARKNAKEPAATGSASALPYPGPRP